MRTPDVLKTTPDVSCLCSQKRMVSRVEYGAGRAVFIGNESHRARPQIRAMQTSGTKANHQKQLQHIVGHAIGRSLRMCAHLSMCRRALQNSQRARIRCNWCACLPEDFSGVRVAAKEIFGRAESCGQGKKTFQARSQPNIMERGRGPPAADSTLNSANYGCEPGVGA